MKPKAWWQAMILALMLQACLNDKPEESQIRDCIKDRYRANSMAAGAGNHDMSEIEILSIQEIRQGEWRVKVKVNGVYENGSIAGEAGAPRPFTEMLDMVFKQDKTGLWTCPDTPNVE